MGIGLYTITTRAVGLVLTAAIYNSDHQVHVTNQNPEETCGYSDDVATMQAASDPGEVGTESLAASLATEIEHLRFAVLDTKKGLDSSLTHWYQTPTPFIPTGSTAKMVFNMAAPPTGWTRVVDAGNTEAVPILRLNSEVPGTGGSWTISGLSGGGHTHSYDTVIAHTHTFSQLSTGGPSGQPFSGSGGAATGGVTNSTGSASGTTASGSETISSDGTWRPKYVDLIVASRD